MPDITLHNSLERKKTLFKPMNPEHVTMYVCGPTVYDRAHIGNARAIVVFDMMIAKCRCSFLLKRQGDTRFGVCDVSRVTSCCGGVCVSLLVLA